jgi:hypothetical protein
MIRGHWWMDWPFRRIDENFTILDIIKWNTVDFKLAGLLWLLMEQRASVVVAAGPIWAGKTTLFHALLDFLRPEIEKVFLRGYDEDFKFLGNEKPENTYLITEEISNHSYEYLWGHQVVKAFEFLSKGYALGCTTHARDIREVAYLFNALGVPLPLIARLGAVITMQVSIEDSFDEEPLRYVDSVNTIDISGKNLVARTLAVRKSQDEPYVYPSEKVLTGIFNNKFSTKYESVLPEVEARGQFLSGLDAKEVCSRQQVRDAVAGYYRAKIV